MVKIKILYWRFSARFFGLIYDFIEKFHSNRHSEYKEWCEMCKSLKEQERLQKIFDKQWEEQLKRWREGDY